MAAYDIQQHFKGLRGETARRSRRQDPFATGFEDDSEEETARPSRSQPNKSPPLAKPLVPGPTSVSSPFCALDALRDSDDDFLDSSNLANRRPSPAPAPLPSTRVTAPAARPGSTDRATLPGLPGKRSARDAAVLAAGSLAYLDDSDDEYEDPRPAYKRTDRYPSPAPRKQPDPADPPQRSPIPRIDRAPPHEGSLTRAQPSVHTVASPFAGTKYLEDSESDSEEEAVTSRQGSADDTTTTSPDGGSREGRASSDSPRALLEVERQDKPKQNGSGVSWRAFSAGRIEQRTAEIEALQASLRQRGKSISFGTHAITDDGKRVPILAAVDKPPAHGRGRATVRAKSPPRRSEATEPTDGEDGDGDPVAIYDPAEFKTNPFTAIQVEAATTPPDLSSLKDFPPSTSPASPARDNSYVQSSASSPESSGMTDSVDSILSKLAGSPQPIPEGRTIDHSLSTVASPISEAPDPLSRNPSTRSRSSRITNSRPTLIPNSRRSSRRSTSQNPSESPAHAFLASWGSRTSMNIDPAPEPQPDDEGQAIGLEGEFIIGRTISRGGFGVVKEVQTIDERGTRIARAVKIVRKAISGCDDFENEKAQLELEHEVSVWRCLKHRHILGLHAVYDTDFATFCVMDLNVGGTLFDLVKSARAGTTDQDGGMGHEPKLAKSYAFQLACALRYLHEDMRVCHRDVKLENCLVDFTGRDATRDGGILRLCDFGLADFLHSEADADGEFPERSEHSARAIELGARTSSVIGTLEYASPKGLGTHRKLFETAGDMWAFGVIVYALCTGDLPFRHPLRAKTVELILHTEWDEGALRTAAAGGARAVELVQGCLEKDIDFRWTIGDALRCSWFDGCSETDGGDARPWASSA